MRVIVIGVLLLLAMAARGQECVVTSTATDMIEISGCASVTIEQFNGTTQTGGPGLYNLTSTFGCNPVIITGIEPILYRICGQTAEAVMCPVGPFGDALSAARACALDLSTQCAEECCEPPAPPPMMACCTVEEDLDVKTWVGHEWADLVGTDGIALGVSDPRIRAEDGFFIGSCDVTGGCHIGCLLGEDLVTTREIFVPACDPTTITVTMQVESVVPGATASLGGGMTMAVAPGTFQLTGSEGPLVFTVPVPTCSSGLAFNVSSLEIDTHCTAVINRTIECPPVECQPGEVLDPNDVCCLPGDLDCRGFCFGQAQEDVCGVCEGDGTSCLDCLDVPNGGREIDACGVCLLPADPGFNQSCVDCAGTPNGEFTIDECGLCLAPNDPTRDTNCTDCNGIPNGPTPPDGCGICFGDNSTCAGCDGVPFSGFVVDECGLCLSPNDPDFDQTCVDCAGVLNGNSTLDMCGRCLPPDDPGFDAPCPGMKMTKSKRRMVYVAVGGLVGGLCLCLVLLAIRRRRTCNDGTPIGKRAGYARVDTEAPIQAAAVTSNGVRRRRATPVESRWAADVLPDIPARARWIGGSDSN